MIDPLPIPPPASAGILLAVPPDLSELARQVVAMELGAGWSVRLRPGFPEPLDRMQQPPPVWVGTFPEFLKQTTQARTASMLLEMRPENAVQGPLTHRRILLTRTIPESIASGIPLVELGARVLVLACIEIQPLPGQELLDLLRHATGRYDDLVLTSLNAAQQLEKLCRGAKLELPRVCQGLRVVAVGPRTAQELVRLGLRVELIAADHDAEGLAAALLAGLPAPRRVLYPRALDGRNELQRLLRAAGWQVDDPPLYRTTIPEQDQRSMLLELRRAGVDIALFASPSAVRNGIRLLGPELAASLLSRCQRGAIGPSTAIALQQLGFAPSFVAHTSTMEGLRQTLLETSARSSDNPEPWSDRT